jgi:predicted transcriptional regulator
MPSPFPGMDPYLEHPGMWPEVHHRLISAIADALEQTLSLDYRVAIEKRLTSSEEFKEGYLEIRDIATGEVVTTIEVSAHKPKPQTILGSQTHLVEIDLLRGGEAMPMLGQVAASDYRILVSRWSPTDHRSSASRPRAELYAFNLEEPIPIGGIPLKSGDAEVVLDLQTLLNGIYDRARYALAIDYTQTPTPPLRKAAQAWAQQLIDRH